MKAELTALYKLQQVDLQLAAALAALAALDSGAAIRKQVADVEKYVKVKSEALHKTEAELNDSELNLKSLEAKRDGFQKKLYDGHVSNPKELSSIEKEIEMLGKSRAKLDERLLELYDVAEKQQAEVTKGQTVLVQLKERLAKLTAQYEAKSKELNAQVEQLTTARQKAVGAVTDRVILQRYEAVRARHKDAGLAVVQDGKCGGCHVSLTPFTIRRLKEAIEIQTCESCGRILYISPNNS